MSTDAPRWMTRALARHCDTLAEVVPRDMRIGGRGSLCPPSRVLGCGRFGCVFPTGRGDIVAKVTRDYDEAHFAIAAKRIGDWPPGIVRYHDIYLLGGSRTDVGWPIYVLWRDSARRVGALGPLELSYWGDGAQAGDLEAPRSNAPADVWVIYWIDRYWRMAREAFVAYRQSPRRRDFLVKAGKLASWADANAEWSNAVVYQVYEHETPLRRFALAVASCRQLAGKMLEYARAANVGEALLFYLDRGLFITDVHLPNLGIVDGSWAITDPGNTIILDDRWDDLDVKRILPSMQNPTPLPHIGIE